MSGYAIYGSGFKAFYLALKLRKIFSDSPIVICTERLGGIYSSIKKNGFQLDLGCHLFDMTDKKFIETFEIDISKTFPVDLQYASINNFGLTHNYALYDFRNNPDYNLITKEFLSKKRNKNKVISLYDWSINRYGKHITKILDNICFKISGKSCKTIDYRSEGMFMFKRILLFDNKKTLSLKKNKLFDNYLAAESKSIHDYSQRHIIFTFPHGNFGFINHLKEVLKKNNIKILEKVPNNFYKINLNNHYKNLKKISTPLHLAYLKCKTFPYTYLHDYSEDKVFRVSSPGIYSNQFINGKSYVCLEIPDPYLKYSKKQIIEASQSYVHKFNKEKNEFLHYVFVPSSYPIYEVFEENLKYEEINPFCYSKNEIMKNIDNYVQNKFNTN